MQSRPSGAYKFIGHVSDHFSKFRIVFPLPSKEASEVADQLNTRVFSFFGLPSILHSDNGKEFVNSVIQATLVIWPGVCSIVNGGVRHSQSQGLVEQGNATIERIISAKACQTGQCTWHHWLPQIQCMLYSFIKIYNHSFFNLKIADVDTSNISIERRFQD